MPVCSLLGFYALVPELALFSFKSELVEIFTELIFAKQAPGESLVASRVLLARLRNDVCAVRGQHSTCKPLTPYFLVCGILEVEQQVK